MSARPFIDSLDFAENGGETGGEVAVADLPRLQDMLESPQGTLKYVLRGVLDELGVPMLEVAIDGICRLRCQRCLGGMDYPVCIETRLMLRDQASLDALDVDDEEEYDSILADPHLDVQALLEEEILLSLPISPRHETGDCRATEGGNLPKEQQHPFAILSKLKAVE